MGEKLVCAFQAHHPEYQRGGIQLPRVFRALRGWRKLAPGLTQWPLPQTLVFAIAGLLLFDGRKKVGIALYVLMLFSIYSRPGEGYHLRNQDLLRLVDQYRHYAIQIAPSEAG